MSEVGIVRARLTGLSDEAVEKPALGGAQSGWRARGLCHRFELERSVLVAPHADALPPARRLLKSYPALSLEPIDQQFLDDEAVELRSLRKGTQRVQRLDGPIFV